MAEMALNLVGGRNSPSCSNHVSCIPTGRTGNIAQTIQPQAGSDGSTFGCRNRGTNVCPKQLTFNLGEERKETCGLAIRGLKSFYFFMLVYLTEFQPSRVISLWQPNCQSRV